MNYLYLFFDIISVALVSYLLFAGKTVSNHVTLGIILWFIFLTVGILALKKVYFVKQCHFKDYLNIFESFIIVSGLSCLAALFFANALPVYMLIGIFTIAAFILTVMLRITAFICRICFKRTKNVLIVGAGQDGKLIAEEINNRPELKLNVVGFLDDNMNNIEDEDASIKILGLTCDSEAVIKDNNVKIVIIAVKSRMDSDILTDLVKGIPLGVKVWRMYRFYEKITHKFLVSKMSVNWLFYDCVRKKALLYAWLKRFCDIIASIAILIITSPISLFAAIGIKLSDLGPVFFTQMRTGKFGKPFKMIKFRTMYQDKVEDDFDDDVAEILSDDKRIMPFCKLLRKFHIDELPQMINVLRGDMSIVGPRAVREEVYFENKENVPFWECRNWVRPGWCGWQQVNINEPTAEQRIGYDLYYIKHQNFLWEIYIFIRYICKTITGKAVGK